MIKRGINNFEIKLIVLISMLSANFYYFFSDIVNVPIIFAIIGRLYTPLFIFLIVNTMIYTKKREKFLLHLWIASLLMYIFNELISIYILIPSGGEILQGNLFGTLFVIALIIYSIQKIKECRKANKPFILYLFLMVLPIFMSLVVQILTSSDQFIYLAIGAMFIFPSILFVDGGIILVLLGVGLYLCNQSKKKITIFYLIICVIVLFMGFEPSESLISMFIFNIQWMMVFALPFMLNYNKQEGYRTKYLFYIFYPLNVYIFAIIANELSKIV